MHHCQVQIQSFLRECVLTSLYHKYPGGELLRQAFTFEDCCTQNSWTPSSHPLKRSLLAHTWPSHLRRRRRVDFGGQRSLVPWIRATTGGTTPNPIGQYIFGTGLLIMVCTCIQVDWAGYGDRYGQSSRRVERPLGSNSSPRKSGWWIEDVTLNIHWTCFILWKACVNYTDWLAADIFSVQGLVSFNHFSRIDLSIYYNDKNSLESF